MKDYLEKLLLVSADLIPFNERKNLPLYLRGGYDLNILRLAGINCLLAEPKEAITLAALRKHRDQLSMLSGMTCVLCFKVLDNYKKQKLISESIPFIIEGKQVYLPFLGIVLEKERERKILSVNKLGASAQCLVLMAMYNDWHIMQLNKIANILNVSKMTVTRCFDELDTLALDMTEKKGKTRFFKWHTGKKALWTAVSPYLVNPVLCEFRLDETIPFAGGVLGGMSAVSHYSMLSDNAYLTYAVTKNDENIKKYRDLSCVPQGEAPAMVIQVINYHLPYGDGMAVDPLSAVLSLTQKEKEDPRVETAVNSILEEVLHG